MDKSDHTNISSIQVMLDHENNPKLDVKWLNVDDKLTHIIGRVKGAE